MKYSKKIWIIPIMTVILILIIVAAISIGTVFVPIKTIIKVILHKIGLYGNTGFEYEQQAIIYYVRLPRVLAAVLIGAALATVGAVLQGMFRNPMADPGIIGVSSGASLGAVAAIALGLSSQGLFYMPLFASVGAILAALIILTLSLRGGRVATFTLILSGIAVSTFFGAVTSMILSITSRDNVHEFIFWAMGNLYSIRWESIKLVVIPIILGVIILMTFARDLNVMLLGEEEAQSVGVNSSKIRIMILLVAAVTTAAAVCISGPISFVGLIVPHIIRIIIGPDHRLLLPASAIGGSIFLVACDLISRVVFIPTEINVGIVTSLVGAPYFLYLLTKSRKGGVI